MANKVREWLQQEETFMPRKPGQRPHRDSADIYSIRNNSEELPVCVPVAPGYQNPFSKRHHKTFPSSDSSIIPFAARKAISAAQVTKLRNSLKDDRKHGGATISEAPRIDGRGSKDFQRRPRHKMRDSAERGATKAPKERKKRASVKKKKLKSADPKGDVSINDFSVDHLTKDRLTLRPSHRLGIFKKGRASTQVKKGLPDLAFSEMKFLDGKSCGRATDETTTSKRKRDCRSQSTENDVSWYFDSSKRRFRDINSDTMNTPCGNHTKSTKRLRQESHSLDVRSPELPVSAIPSRSSPRSAMVEVLRRKGIYPLPANRSPRESNNGPNTTQAIPVGGGPDRDADDHSEYSREGFQMRFKADTKGSTDVRQGRDRERTHSSTDCHTISHLGPVDDNCNHGLEEEPTSTMVRTEVQSNAKATVKQVSDTLKPVTMAEEPPALRGRYTPEPSGIKETPDSSSPLAALLRVCANSPTIFAAQEQCVLASDRKIRQSARALAQKPRKLITPHGYREQGQLRQDCKQRPSKILKPLDAPEAKTSTRFESAGQGRGDPDNPKKPGDWDALPEDFYGKYGGNSPYSGQQEEAGRSRGFRGQIIHYHSSDRASGRHPCVRVAYNQDANLTREGVLLGFGAEHPDQGRRGPVYGVPDEYIYEDSEPESVEDLLTEVSSDHARVALNGCYTSGSKSGDWDEGRQTYFGQLCAVVDQHQAVGTGRYPIENDGYENAGHNRHEPGHEKDHLGLTRGIFWRRHTLG